MPLTHDVFAVQVSGSSADSLTMHNYSWPHAHTQSHTRTHTRPGCAIKYASGAWTYWSPKPRRLINIQNYLHDQRGSTQWQRIRGQRMPNAGCRMQEQRGDTHTHHTHLAPKRSFVCILDLCVCICPSNLCGIENFSRFDILTLADKIYGCMYGLRFVERVVNMPAWRVIRFICMAPCKNMALPCPSPCLSP